MVSKAVLSISGRSSFITPPDRSAPIWEEGIETITVANSGATVKKKSREALLKND